MDTPPARLLLVDEHALFRSAMAAAFDAHPTFSVVGEAATVTAGKRAMEPCAPDVVLVSTNLHGFAALAESREAAGRTSAKLVGVSDRPDQWALRSVVEAGMHGYVTKDMELRLLVKAVCQVLSGEAFVPPGMLAALLRGLIDRNREADRALQRFMRLTRREKEVLELLVEGCDHDAVADILGISPQTARTHVQNVITKLGAHSRLEAVAMAVEHRLVERLPAARTP